MNAKFFRSPFIILRDLYIRIIYKVMKMYGLRNAVKNFSAGFKNKVVKIESRGTKFCAPTLNLFL